MKTNKAARSHLREELGSQVSMWGKSSLIKTTFENTYAGGTKPEKSNQDFFQFFLQRKEVLIFQCHLQRQNLFICMNMKYFQGCVIWKKMQYVFKDKSHTTL